MDQVDPWTTIYDGSFVRDVAFAACDLYTVPDIDGATTWQSAQAASQLGM